ncbi:MAG: peptidyl-prolyl cis-trans isomerase [Phycisphaeraceae bacterium]
MAMIINGQNVDTALVDQEFSNVKSYFESMSNVQCCERDDEFRGYARDNVVARVLLTQEAQKAIEPSSDAEIDAELARMKEEQGGEVQFYATMGIGPDDEAMLRPDIDVNLRIQKLMAKAAEPLPEPSDEQLRAFYEEHLEQFMSEEQVHALHMLKNPRRGEERAGAYDELRQARKEALAGADFAELAKRYSQKYIEWEKADAETRERMGDPIDLGHFARGQMMEEFEAVAFSLEDGEVGPVFLTHFGYHLVKVLERKPAVPKPFDEVRDDVATLHLETHRQQAVQRFVEKLKESAKIEYTEGEDQPQGAGHSH